MSYSYKGIQIGEIIDEGGGYEIFFMPEFWIMVCITALITAFINKMTSKEKISFKEALFNANLFEGSAVMTFLLVPFTCIGMICAKISFDYLIPTYALVFTATYCWFLIKDKLNERENKSRKARAAKEPSPNEPPEKKPSKEKPPEDNIICCSPPRGRFIVVKNTDSHNTHTTRKGSSS